MFAVQSTPWLLAHELRLTMRGVRAAKGMKWRGPILILGFLLATAVFVPVGLVLRGVEAPITTPVSQIAALAIAAIFTLMVSQGLAATTETFYARGDLDLLFSSPIGPRKVLFTRCLAIAVKVFIVFALLITPALGPIALLGHPAWLAVYLVLAAAALLATASGLTIATLLFRVIGPKRTRAVAQFLAAAIGAGFFLAFQFRNLTARGGSNPWTDILAHAGRSNARATGAMSWPLRAMLGQPAPLMVGVCAGLIAFFAVTVFVGRRFAANTAAASGATVVKTRNPAGSPAFAAGAFHASFRKELRLLIRDVPLLGQVLLRLLYVAPLIFLVLRNAGHHAGDLLPRGVGLITFVTGQLAGSLVWITVAAEEAPELLACAPASAAVVRRAKLAAALAPLLILAIPLLGLTVLAPLAGAAALVGCATNAAVSGLIGLTLQKPAKRSAFRQRGQGGSFLATFAELIGGVCISALAFSAVLWPVALPVLLIILAAAAYLVLGRSGGRPLSKSFTVVQ